MIGFGQSWEHREVTEKSISYIGEGKYQISKMPGAFPLPSWVGKWQKKAIKDIADNAGYSIKTSYVLNLIDILTKAIELPSNKKLASLPLTEQIKQISKYVVLIKVK